MNPELKNQIEQIMKQIETHDDLKIINELYRKRWYEIDKNLARNFKKGDFIKWYKKKQVYWGMVVEEVKLRNRSVTAISTNGSEWTIGGSVVQKVEDPKRIQKIIAQLREHGMKIEVNPSPPF